MIEAEERALIQEFVAQFAVDGVHGPAPAIGVA